MFFRTKKKKMGIKYFSLFFQKKKIVFENCNQVSNVLSLFFQKKKKKVFENGNQLLIIALTRLIINIIYQFVLHTGKLTI